MKAARPTVERLHELLRLDPETGRLYWRVGRQRAPKGAEALRWVNRTGYRAGFIDGYQSGAHRVVYALAFGEWPTGQIDHRNGVRDDNRPSNLRDVDQSVNNKNKTMHGNNTSGVTGVAWCKRTGRWQCYINIEGRLTSLGRFKDFDEAVAVRKAAEREHGYTERHGERRAA